MEDLDAVLKHGELRMLTDREFNFFKSALQLGRVSATKDKVGHRAAQSHLKMRNLLSLPMILRPF